MTEKTLLYEREYNPEKILLTFIKIGEEAVSSRGFRLDDPESNVD